MKILNSINMLSILLMIGLLLGIIFILSRPTEPFWGGYFPVPYAGQCIKDYGRTWVNAATDQPPRLYVNDNAYNINP